MLYARNVINRSCYLAIAMRLCRFQPHVQNVSRLFSAADGVDDFVPLPPPTSKGTPIYPDIDLDHAKSIVSEASKRNADPKSVFVVNGSSRGIGLQFVKSLLVRTQVRERLQCRTQMTKSSLMDC